MTHTAEQWACRSFSIVPLAYFISLLLGVRTHKKHSATPCEALRSALYWLRFRV